MAPIAPVSRSAAARDSGASIAATSFADRLSSGANARFPAAVSDSGPLPRVRRGRLAAHIAATNEALQDAAQVPGIEPELGRELARGDRRAVRELVEDAHLGKRPGAVQQPLVQHADAPRVEAVEPADRLDAGAGRFVHLVDIVNQMVDSVK